MRIIGLVVSVCVFWAGMAVAVENAIKDGDGKTVAVVIDCGSCKAPKKDAACESGVGAGFNGDAPCGHCLIAANSRSRIAFPQDVTLTGRLNDEKGQPVKATFVKLYTPNFGVRTRTTDDGQFFLRLGASQPQRKGEKGVVVELGTRVMRTDTKLTEYALFLLPPNYAACAKTP